MNIQNIIATINSHIQLKQSTFSIKLIKKNIIILDILQSLGYLSYSIQNRTPNLLQCSISFAYNDKQEIILKTIKILSTASRSLFSKKDTISRTRTFLTHSKGISAFEDNINGKFLFKITV